MLTKIFGDWKYVSFALIQKLVVKLHLQTEILVDSDRVSVSTKISFVANDIGGMGGWNLKHIWMFPQIQ